MPHVLRGRKVLFSKLNLPMRREGGVAHARMHVMDMIDVCMYVLVLVCVKLRRTGMKNQPPTVSTSQYTFPPMTRLPYMSPR